jgi:hypothetical protein
MCGKHERNPKQDIFSNNTTHSTNKLGGGDMRFGKTSAVNMSAEPRRKCQTLELTSAGISGGDHSGRVTERVFRLFMIRQYFGIGCDGAC